MIFIPYSLRSKPRFNLTSIKGWVREWINFFILRKTPLHFCDWCSKLFIKKKDGLELWCRCYKYKNSCRD